MPFVYHGLREGTLVHVIGWGEVTLSDSLDVWNAKRQDPLVAAGHSVLCDITRVTSIDFAPDEYLRLRESLQADMDRAASRVAIVAERNHNWSGAKMWEAQADLLGRACITFNDVRTACIWLGIDEDTYQQVLQQKLAVEASGRCG